VSESDEDRADALFTRSPTGPGRHPAQVLAGEHSVSALAAKYDMSFAAVPEARRVLERPACSPSGVNGREQLASGDVTAVRSVASMLTAGTGLAWPHRAHRQLIAFDIVPVP